MRDESVLNDILSEIDFYPPSDDRTWKSYVKDISNDEEDENNFAGYCKYIFELLEEEGYYES